MAEKDIDHQYDFGVSGVGTPRQAIKAMQSCIKLMEMIIDDGDIDEHEFQLGANFTGVLEPHT